MESDAGRRIRRLREQRAWTQQDLAEAAKISVRTVQRAEEGAMSADTLKAIASALGEAVEAMTNPASQYPSVTPILYYDDPRSVDWLVAVLGVGIRMKIPGPDGKIVHGELTIGDGLIMIGTPIEDAGWTTPRRLEGACTQSVYVRVDNADAHHDAAKAAGGQPLCAPEDAHGHRRYKIEDPEGHLWWFFHELS